MKKLLLSLLLVAILGTVTLLGANSSSFSAAAPDATSYNPNAPIRVNSSVAQEIKTRYSQTGKLSSYEQQALNAYQTPITPLKPTNLPGTRNVLNVFPQNANYWTGTTNGTTKTQTSLVKGVTTESGWFTFDISSIPVGSTINSVTFNGYVNAAVWPYWSLTPVTVNPLTASAAELAADITAEAGTSASCYLFQNESSGYAAGWKTHALPALAVTNLTAALTQGWIAMGMVSRDNSTSYYLYFDGWAETNRPYLTIDYTPNIATGPNLAGGIVSPVTGYTTDNFTYSVQYMHTAGTAPVSAKVYTRPNSLAAYTAHNMTFPTGTPDYTTFQTFTYATTLAAGADWQFYFEFDDGASRTVVYNPDTAPTTPHDGPDVFIPRTLTVLPPIGNGTVSPAPGNYTYNDGQVVPIYSYPASGHSFIAWTGNVANTTGGITTVTMNQNQDIQASFTPYPEDNLWNQNTLVQSANTSVIDGATDYQVADNFLNGNIDEITKVVATGIMITNIAGVWTPWAPDSVEPFIVRFYDEPVTGQPDWLNPVSVQNIDGKIYRDGFAWGDYYTYKVELDLITPMALNSGWVSAQINVDGGAGGWFLFLLASAGGYDTTFYQATANVGTSTAGNVMLELWGSSATYPAPVNQTSTSVLHNRATLGWTESGTATQWDIEWGAAGFTQGTGTMLSAVTSRPYNLLGLSPNTSYGWYVRANYGGGIYSAWTGPQTFTTLGNPLTVPWTEGFEAGFVKLLNNAGNGVPWTLNTSLFSEGIQSAFNDYTPSNTNILRTTSYFDLTPFPEPMLTFSQIAKTEAGWDHCYIEISTDAGATWTILPVTAYQGTGAYALPSSNTPEGPCFTENAYTDWGTSDVTPTNTWWKPETFNLSAYKTSTNVMLRFRLKADTSVERYGWLIDNVSVNSRDFYTGTDITGFTLPEQTGAATIDNGAYTVEIEVVAGTDPSALRPSFTLSPGAKALVENVLQVSGVTAQDFSSPVTYMIEAENGDRQEWVVTVNVATTQSSAKDILTYSFPQQAAPAVIDAVGHTVTIHVPYMTNVTALVATFTLSPFATATVGGVPQVSGTTANNFTNPVTYIVNAEDSSTQAWVVTVIIDVLPVISLPWTEGFDGATFAPTGWTNLKTAGTSTPGIWDRATSGTYPTCSPQAGAAMARFNSYSISTGGTAILVTPPLNLPAGNLKTSFWMYRDSGYNTTADRVNVYYNTANNTTGATLLGTINRAMGLAPVVTTAGWYNYSFPLPSGGSNIGYYVILEAVSGYGNNMFVDSFSIQEVINNDLAAATITGPNQAIISGTALNYSVGIVNNGVNTQNSYTVLLKSVTPPATLATMDVTTPLIGGAAASHILSWTPTATGSYTIYGEVVPLIDTVPANNVTANYPVTIYPQGILMESFETGVIPSNWTVLNVDGGDAWQAYAGSPHSGTYSARVVYDIPNNDWLITPPLVVTAAGADQISFWITTSSSYSESWEVLYSTTDTNPASFTLMDSGTLPIASPYVQKVYNLDTFIPGDAIIYIALRCVSNDMLYFFADDFVGPMIYVPTSLPTPVVHTNVVGSNVVISWDPIPYAYQYKIYEADDPYGTFSLIVPSTAGTSYTIAAPVTKKFYKVVATSDPIRAERTEQPLARDEEEQLKLRALRDGKRF